MKKDEIKKVELINSLLKKQTRLLKRISRLYDLAIWAGNTILNLQNKVNDIQDRITKHVNELEHDDKVEEIIDKIEKQIDEQSKEELKQFA